MAKKKTTTRREAPELDPTRVHHIAPAMIRPDPKQPSSKARAQSIESLTRSVAALGVRQPITIRDGCGATYMIVSGERRWRAAKAAGLEAIPCIVEADDGTMKRAASQLAENLEREGLSPMDTARFLVDLQTREKRSTNELVAELAKLGIESVSKARVERILGFVDLPKWATELLEQGKLKESHAAALVPSLKYPKVLEYLQGWVEDELRFMGEIQLKELQTIIEDAYFDEGRTLKPGKRHARHGPERKFDLAVCKGCEFRVKIGGGEVCMSPADFDKKNAQALDLQAKKDAERKSKSKAKQGEDRTDPDPTKVSPRQLKKNEHGVVVLTHANTDHRQSLEGVPFDVRTCEGCVHKHLAGYGKSAAPETSNEYCFHLPCFEVKHRAARKDELYTDKLVAYLDAWLRPVVLAEIPARAKPLVIQGLTFWLATGAIDRGRYQQRHEVGARETLKILEERELSDLPAVFEYGKDPAAKSQREVDLARAAVRAMNPEQLRWFARLLGIGLVSNGYKIDEAYLALQKKAQLVELCRTAKLEDAKGTVPTLRAKLLAEDARNEISVPADLQALYEEPYERASEFGDGLGGRFDLDDEEGFEDPDGLDVDPEALAAAAGGADE